MIAFSGDTAPCESMVRLAQDADVLIHECTFPESFIEHRRRTRAGVKSLVATHFGHFDSTNPVIKRAATKHLPVELMGPHLVDEVAADIRKNYDGPFRLAHDMMRIDL